MWSSMSVYFFTKEHLFTLEFYFLNSPTLAFKLIFFYVLILEFFQIYFLFNLFPVLLVFFYYFHIFLH